MSSLMCAAAGIVLPTVFAYVGPGPGLSMLWALLGLLVTVLAAFSAIAVWPLRVLMRRWRGRPTANESSTRAARG